MRRIQFLRSLILRNITILDVLLYSTNITANFVKENVSKTRRKLSGQQSLFMKMSTQSEPLVEVSHVAAEIIVKKLKLFRIRFRKRILCFPYRALR